MQNFLVLVPKFWNQYTSSFPLLLFACVWYKLAIKYENLYSLVNEN